MTDDNRDPEVEVKQTPLTAREYARALLKAWKNRFGAFPSKEQVGVLYGQFMVETSGKHVFNWNLGNIKEIPNDGLPFMSLRGVWEIVHGKRVELPKTHPGSRFTAFENIDQGADWYLLKLRQRFGASWPYIEKGDPDGFARALKRQRYYTADENVYAKLLGDHWRAFMRSPAYDEALSDLLAALEAPTMPSFEVVHPPVPIRGFEEEDDPDPEAA